MGAGLLVSLKKRAVSAICLLCWLTGVTALLLRQRGSAQKVLTYHHVLPDAALGTGMSDQLAIGESELARQLAIIQRRRSITTELDVPDTVVITFDDGALNNYEVAAPVLERFGAAAFFFVPLDVIRTGRLPWVDWIFLWADRAPDGMHDFGEGLVFDVFDRGSRSAAIRRLIEVCETDRPARRRVVGAIAKWAHGDPNISATELFRLRFKAMDEGQLAELKARGHKVGAHSVHHDRLTSLDGPSLQADLNECYAAVGEVYNTDVFCYPLGGRGDVSSEVMAACWDAGFGAAFINLPYVPEGLRAMPRFALPRHFVPAGAPAWVIDAKLAGLEDLLRDATRRCTKPWRYRAGS